MFLMFAYRAEWIYRLHSTWFTLPRETFNALLYGFPGVFKLLVIVFNAVPFVVLSLMG